MQKSILYGIFRVYVLLKGNNMDANHDKISKLKKQMNFARPIFLLLLVLVVVVFTAVLKITASVFIPATLAVLISLVFEPLLLTLNKRFRIPWLLGIALILIIVLVAVTAFGSLLISSLLTIVDLFPKYEERFTTIYTSLADFFSLSFNEDFTLIQNLWSQAGIRQTLQNFALSFSGNLFSFFTDVTLVTLFAVFFLMELRYLRKKLDIMFGDENKEKVTGIITNIIEQTIRYISVKFFISLATGIFVFLGTLIIGLDFPIIWGFIAFVLNFIPNFGSIISGILTTIFALVQFFPEPAPVIATLILMLGVNFMLGNFLEPRVQGRQLGLSPFVIIVSLSFWGWLWGFTGLVVGVPMMVILKIVCENFSTLHPISVFLGSYTEEKERAEEIQDEQEKEVSQ